MTGLPHPRPQTRVPHPRRLTRVPYPSRVFVFAARVGITLSLCAALASSASHWDRVPAKDHARPNPLAGRPEAVHAGAILYRDHCQQCHQADAAGDGKKKPSLKTDAVRNATDGDLEWFLRQGDLGHGMPSWSSLPEAQRWQIITYLRSLQQQAVVR